MTIKITPNDKGNPPGKLADAELHFTEGPLEGLKLIGFSVWERRGGGGRNVTFPARQYSVNGERRSFALLRPVVDTTAGARSLASARAVAARERCSRSPAKSPATSAAMRAVSCSIASWHRFAARARRAVGSGFVMRTT